MISKENQSMNKLYSWPCIVWRNYISVFGMTVEVSSIFDTVCSPKAFRHFQQLHFTGCERALFLRTGGGYMHLIVVYVVFCRVQWGWRYVVKCHSNQLAVKGVIWQLIWLLDGGIHTGRDGNVWCDREMLGKCRLSVKKLQRKLGGRHRSAADTAQWPAAKYRPRYLQSSKY